MIKMFTITISILLVKIDNLHKIIVLKKDDKDMQ